MLAMLAMLAMVMTGHGGVSMYVDQLEGERGGDLATTTPFHTIGR